MGGTPSQNITRVLPAVTASISPPTRRRYSVAHSDEPYCSPPPSPVSVWSSLEPIVNTTASGWSWAITSFMCWAQLKISGRASPVATWPSTPSPTTSTTWVPGARLRNDSPGVIDNESPPTHTLRGSVGENASFFGGSVVAVVGAASLVIGFGSF